MESVVDISLKEETKIQTFSVKEEVKQKNAVLKCEKCSKKFSREEIYNAHVEFCGVKPKFKCSLCNEKIHNETLFLYHRNHLCRKAYKCPLCPKHFSDLSSVKYHVRNVEKRSEDFWEKFKAEKGIHPKRGTCAGGNLRWERTVLKFWDQQPVLLSLEEPDLKTEVPQDENVNSESVSVKEEAPEVVIKTEPNLQLKRGSEALMKPSREKDIVNCPKNPRSKSKRPNLGSAEEGTPKQDDVPEKTGMFKRRKLFGESHQCHYCGKTFEKAFKLKIHLANTLCGR